MPLATNDYVQAAKTLGCEPAAIAAVAKVEAAGRTGFHRKSGEPTILFERHVFHRLALGEHGTETVQRWASLYPGICNPVPGGYIGGYAEHARLQKAVKLSREMALMSASWGLFQIMGFNYRMCQFATIQAFINCMYDSDQCHLAAFVAYIQSARLADELQRRDWHGFARLYNGPAYHRNRYAERMAVAYQQIKAAA